MWEKRKPVLKLLIYKTALSPNIPYTVSEHLKNKNTDEIKKIMQERKCSLVLISSKDLI